MAKASTKVSKSPKPARVVKKKTKHPLVGVEDAAVYPFPEPKLEKDAEGNVVEWSSGKPADYDASQHAPLKKVDFATDWQYSQYKVELREAKLASAIEQRDTAYTLGSAADRAGAKRLASMAKRISEIQAKLAAGGADVKGILKAAGVDMEALAALVNAE